MSKMFYSPKVNQISFKIGYAPETEKMNSFSTQPKMGQGVLGKKGLFGEVDQNILKLLEEEKSKKYLFD